MAFSPDDFATSFRVLSTKACSIRDLHKAFKSQNAQWEKGKRRPIAEILAEEQKVALQAGPVDLKAHPEVLRELGELLLHEELVTDHELDGLVDEFNVRPDPKSLPSLTPPKSLTFDFEWEIGRSRRSVAFRCLRNSKPLALKIYRADAFPGAAERTAFVERLSALSKEPAAGLVGILETGEAEGHAWVALELIEGPPIGQLIADHKMSLRRGFEIIERAVRNLAPLHAKGQAHGSLSASNILVTGDDRPHISEFGWVAGGTPADDVFALGAVLYEIAAGAPPFGGFRPTELKPPSLVNGAAGGAPEKIVIKALAREPGRRYANGAELADDLSRYLKHEAVLADVPVSAAAPVHLVTKKGGYGPRIAVALIAAGILGVGLWSLLKSKPSDPGVTPEADKPYVPSTGSTPPEAKKKRPPPDKTDPRREEIKNKGPLKESEERDIRFKGTGAMANRDWDALEKLADEALLRGPERDWAHQWMAMVHKERGDLNQALHHANKSIEMKPDNAPVVRLRYELLLSRAEFKMALANVEAVFPKGYGDEIRQLGEAIKANEKDARIYLERGILYHHRKHYASAIKDFQKGVTLGDYSAHYFRALSLIGDERTPEAVAALREFLATQAGSPGAAEARQLLSELGEK